MGFKATNKAGGITAGQRPTGAPKGRSRPAQQRLTAGQRPTGAPKGRSRPAQQRQPRSLATQCLATHAAAHAAARATAAAAATEAKGQPSMG